MWGVCWGQSHAEWVRVKGVGKSVSCRMAKCAGVGKSVSCRMVSE